MPDFNVQVEGLGKCYRIYSGPMRRIVEGASFGRILGHRPFWALRDVNFTVKPGGSMGLCGANGAGKSTLLKVLAGTTHASEGRYRVHGRVSSLLELGTGFHMDFTGRDNIVSNGIMMGFSRRAIAAKSDEIIDFAELGDYIDEPVRTYSSGMGLRLAFSVAMAVDPDVMIIDEVFAVGDMYFQKKCVDKVYELKKRNKTLLFCSHSLYDVRQLCDEALWLRDGKTAAIGHTVDVTNDYSSYQRGHIDEHADGQVPRTTGRAPVVVDARIYRAGTDEEVYQATTGDSLEVRVWWKNPDPEQTPIHIGIGLFHDSSILAGMTTQFDSFAIRGDEGCTVGVLPEIDILSGNFLIAIYLLDGEGVHQYQQYLLREPLQVRFHERAEGLIHMRHRWEDRSDLELPAGLPRIREGRHGDVSSSGDETGETGGWTA